MEIASHKDSGECPAPNCRLPSKFENKHTDNKQDSGQLPSRRGTRNALGKGLSSDGRCAGLIQDEFKGYQGGWIRVRLELNGMVRRFYLTAR